MNPSANLMLFIGRFHPVMVHLPIGLIVALAGLELIAHRPRFQEAKAAAGYLLALATPAVVLSAMCGWMLSLDGGYDPRLLAFHKWTGVATALFCTIAAVFYWREWTGAYRGCLAMTLCLVLVAGHLGGSLTHGSGYLFEHAPTPIRSLLGRDTAPVHHPTKPGEIAEQRAFADVVGPILRERCVACHNEQKRKGGLRLDTIEGLLQGGERGPVLIPGKASQSEMIRRLQLPVEHDDHMPPEGKPQPTPEETALLEWWIDAGAPVDKKVGDLNPPDAVQRMIERMTGAAKP